MKKNLMIIVAFVLIFTHIIPPHNISFANDEVNECESMNFTVQTIKENDKTIKGTGFSSDHLKVEFTTKNQRETVNVNSGGQFELKVEDEFLELNDDVTISNEYFKIETKVVSEESSSQVIHSSQYVECPVIIEAESDETDETSKEASEDSEDSDATTEDTSEDNKVSDATTEDTSEDNKVSDATTEDTLEGSEDSDASAGDTSEDSEDSDASAGDTSEDSEDSDASAGDTSEDSEDSDASAGDTSEGSEDSDATTEDTSKSDEIHLNDIEKQLENSTTHGIWLSSKELVSEQEEINIERFNNLVNQNSRLINLRLLSDVTLTGQTITNELKPRIELSFNVNIPVGLSIGNIFITFLFPPEINVGEVDIIEFTYDERGLLNLGRKTGNIEDAVFDAKNNQISFERKPLVLQVLSSYTYDLILELDKLPPTINGEYVFKAAAGNAFINLDILSSDGETITLPAPQLPEGTVSFDNVPPEIIFDPPVMDYTQTNMRIPRENPDWTIDILDTRDEGSQYSISAEAEAPLTNTENQYSLPDALVYVNGNDEPKSLYGNSVKVHDGVKGNEEIIENTWEADEGVLLEVNPRNVQPGTYETTINWTLTDGP